MKLPYYLLLAAAAVTPAFAQTAAQSTSSNSLSYDRVSVAYSSNSIASGMSFNGAALLGSNFLVGGSYSDVNYKKELDGLSGTGTGFGVGYKLSAGPGDLIFSLGYSQLQVSGVIDTVAVVVIGEQTDFGIGYRMKINQALEVSASYTHRAVDAVAGGYDLASGESAGEFSSENYNDFSLGARYNLNKSFDVSLGYTISSAKNTWSLSAGYNF